MICPTCNHPNPKGILFCEECKGFLPDAIPGLPDAAPEPITETLAPPPPVTATPPPALTIPAPAQATPPPPIPAPGQTPPVFEDSPFGDFLPAWMSPKPAANSAPAPAAPAWSQPTAAAPASLSVDALLQDSTSLKPVAPASPPPMPSWGNSPAAPGPQAVATFNQSGPGPLADPIESLPVPSYQLPPLWYKQAVENPWQEIRAAEQPRAVPSNSISNDYNASLAGPETRLPHEVKPAPEGPTYGIDRGFYFFHDASGNVVLHALAGFGRRLAGAIIDSIISSILGIIFFYAVVSLFLNLDPYNYEQSILGITLALLILPVLFGFLYHTILVGLTGQTLGDRLLKIKVLRRGGKAVGLVSGVVRALYGLVPAIISAILALNLPASSRNSVSPGSIIGAVISGVTALGLAWALFDKSHQGLHDKLADTYVVSVKES
ncbi:MAG: RDD family protein [Chloroflexi bacterium]|nr:RDD family protein [Chloroflexota bacterium]OJV98345.1 MAG: hypothetical protein BGO39_16350 [Chloroflexi bacterium 54-19]